MTLADVTERRTAGLYLRVSGAQQDLNNQRHHLVRLARARGLEIVEVYAEQVSSSKARPEFQRMMRDAHRGRWNCLIVWALDRLGRDLRSNIDTVLALDAVGVRLISHEESWLDNGGPLRDLLVSVFSWIAQQERQRIGERTKAGLEKARRKGIRLGRPRVSVDIEEAVRLREKEGLSLRQAARRLGIGASTLCKLLKARDELEAHAEAVPISGAREWGSNFPESRSQQTVLPTSDSGTPEAAE